MGVHFFSGEKSMPLSFREAHERFIDYCRVCKTLSHHTLRAYDIDLAHATARMGALTDVQCVSREVLRAYIGRMLHEEALAEATVKRRIATLKQLFKWLEREELVEISPFHRLEVTIRLPHRLPRALSSEDMRRLLMRSYKEMEEGNFSTLAMHFAIVIMFVSGLRVGELTELSIDDLAIGMAGLLVHGKGNRERHVFLSGKDAKSLLKTYLKRRSRIMSSSPRLLIDADGEPWTAQSLRRRLVALAKRADISRRVTPHMLRHTAATQLIEAGVDIRFVQKLLGHASIATTQIYTQVSDSSLRSTLEKANTLDRIVNGRRR
jgi:integrase/recombinase XerD